VSDHIKPWQRVWIADEKAPGERRYGHLVTFDEAENVVNADEVSILLDGEGTIVLRRLSGKGVAWDVVKEWKA
jgi:hypothetical protein